MKLSFRLSAQMMLGYIVWCGASAWLSAHEGHEHKDVKDLPITGTAVGYVFHDRNGDYQGCAVDGAH